ncbi:MAG: ribosome maturation factor RimP [Oscillospiraceae bacterium]|nr:ribosome maturation factor RimP [Oscillospiraceae bacterium]
MALKSKEVVEAVTALAAPPAADLGLTLWDVVFRKEGSSLVLRLIIDRPGGVFIEDCEKLSRAVDPQLDALDIADGEYRFEVSSPGLMRELRTDAQLTAYIGKPVVVGLYKPDGAGNKEYRGELAAFGADALQLRVGGRTADISRKDAASVKADDDVNIGGNNR